MLNQKHDSPLRRQPSGFQFAIAGRIEYLKADHWDCVTSDASVFMSRRFLESAQKEFFGKIIRDFGIVYDKGDPVAAVATQTFDVVGDQLIGKKSADTKNLPDQLKRKSLSLFKRRIMICGNVHTWGPHGVAIASGSEPERVWQGIDRFLDVSPLQVSLFELLSG